MEFGIQTRGTFDYVRDAARWAEDNGLAAFAVPDHYIIGKSDNEDGYDTDSPDVYPQLGGLAVATRSIQLSVLVSPVTYRHPASLLKLGLALDDMSDGRFTLGVGTGWLRAEHTIFGFPFPDWTERFERLQEALSYLRAALSEGRHGFDGAHYQLATVDHQPRPRNLRIMVGGSGPKKTPELAGRFADEFNIYSLPPADLAARVEVAQRTAESAGRDPAALLLSSAAPPIVGPNQAAYRARLEAFAASRFVSVDRLEESFRDIAVPMGTYEEARQTFGHLAGSGIDRYYFQILGSFDLDYAAELLEVLG